ncbi:hypothetical protein DAPPUDRAFT_112285 [Daphnia pulex]|uniref:Uncharacterized protein n=1 Tax=Daphnia pulex TaxID=6669 RepID=E9HBJ5_DAPPU|nr:hypothetical protein DAPPUDRAFT_112285 [Daphnia pulex]|eukprot:EFX70905.1 hypothetical protein DAPPUDRAFT_112285 [Daphnia pulex]
MASTTKACGNPACPVTFTSVGNRKNSRDRSWAPSPSTITTRALSPVTSARLTRPSTASPGTSSTPTRPARRNHSSRPSRRPPDRDPGMSICITDGSIQLAHPLPAKVFCSTCGTSRRWSGRNCISDAIRHFRTFHGKSVNVLVECSYCCNISKTVQAAFFHQEKACPGLAPPDQLDSTSPAGETQLLGDKVILLYPPRPSKCPLCSWTCARTRADANGTPTTGVADEMRVVCCCWVWQQKGFQQPLVLFPTPPVSGAARNAWFSERAWRCTTTTGTQLRTSTTTTQLKLFCHRLTIHPTQPPDQHRITISKLLPSTTRGNNSGPFGLLNRLGYPSKVKNGGIFVEIATATSSIYSRYIRTLETEADWQPMCFLPNVMVYKCKPDCRCSNGISAIAPTVYRCSKAVIVIVPTDPNSAVPNRFLESGRPTKKKALDHHNFIPKCFAEKLANEQAKMVLTWVAGATNAERALANNQKLDQDQIKVRPEDVSTALIEEDFDHETFKHFFDDDAWASVASLGNHLIPKLHVGWVN